MAEAFDPYYKWLGIPPKDQPPNHYRLLAIEVFESDAEVIDAAANRQMAYVQDCATGPYLKESQQLLNAISSARVCLLNAANKATYDAQLREQLAAKAGAQVTPPPLGAPPAPPPVPGEPPPFVPPAVSVVVDVGSSRAVAKPVASSRSSSPRTATTGSTRPRAKPKSSLFPLAVSGGVFLIAIGGLAAYLATRSPQSATPKVAAQVATPQPVAADTAQQQKNLVAAMNVDQSRQPAPKAPVPPKATTRKPASPTPARPAPPTSAPATPASSAAELAQLPESLGTPATAKLPGGKDVLAFPLARGGHLLFASVQINGQDAGRFVVDTGAGYVGVSNGVAARLKLPELRRANVHTALGLRPMSMRQVDSLTLGGIEFKGLTVAAFDGRAAAAEFGAPIDGVIGYEVLAVLPFTVDYAAPSLTFRNREKFQAPDAVEPDELTVVNNQPFAEAGIEGRSGVLLMSTGTPAALVLEPLFAFQAKIDAEDKVRAAATQRMLTTADATLEATQPRVDQLLIFGEDFASLYASVPVAAGAVYVTPARRIGLVGSPVLSRFKLTFDYAEKKVWAEPAGEATATVKDVLGLTPLHLAALEGDAAGLKSALTAKVDVEAKDVRGRTPLLIASQRDHAEIIKMLLERKANPNAGDAAGETPLLAATRNKKYKTVELLLAAKANPQLANKAGETPLAVAKKNKQDSIIKRLIAAGAK